MDGELGIYNKFGGSGKYNIPNLMDGGGLITNDNNEYKEKRDRIKRLEEKILILQNELDRLNKDLKEKKSSKV
jgi:hypothetical protein